MSELKVGDRVSLSTGAIFTVSAVNGADDVWIFRDGTQTWLSFIENLGITWELVKPELVEPPYGSTIHFRDKDGTVRTAWSNSGYWLETLDQESYTWWQLIQHYRFTEFELLRPEKEVVKKVLDKLQGFVNSHTYARVQKIAKEYGVEL